MQWTMWAMTELDMRLFEILMLHMPAGVHPIGEPEGYHVYFGREKTAKTTPQRLQWLYNELVWPLGVLEGALEKVDWLGAADHFTAADLNVSVVLGWALGAGVAFEDFPRVQDWLHRCHSRPLSPYNRTPPAYLTRDVSEVEQVGPFGRFSSRMEGITERYGKL